MKISCVFWACGLGHMCAGGEPCMYVSASQMRAGRVGCVWASGQVPTERPAGWPGCLSDRVSCVAGQLSALPKSTHLWTKQCRAWGPGNVSPHPHPPTPPATPAPYLVFLKVAPRQVCEAVPGLLKKHGAKNDRSLWRARGFLWAPALFLIHLCWVQVGFFDRSKKQKMSDS